MYFTRGDIVHLIHEPHETALAASVAARLRDNGIAADRRTAVSVETVPDHVARRLDQTARDHLRIIDTQPVENDERVFISYAREDEPEARLFHLALLREGMFTSFDQSETSCGILASEDWMEWIFRRLSSCWALACFFSEAAKVSTFVNHELGFFLERMKRHNVPCIFVLPHEINVDALRSSNARIIEFYKMSATQAACAFIEEMARFFGVRENDQSVEPST
jgi:hypothetical protein